MSWPELMDPALQEYIEDRQAKALRAYEDDADLLEEHIRQEDNYRVGGYGTRQIGELLQNAVDALTQGGRSGRVEFRIADGALYCANEGEPFARKGLRAVTYSFLSPKDDDSIGRFGLGFKSVLGVTDNPQVYSRTVSFEFNGSAAAEIFAGVRIPGGRLPLLRIPMLADQRAAFAADPNLMELGKWATTIVKLPLARDGQRLREELISEFRSDSLVFLRSISRLDISTRGSDGAMKTREYRRMEEDSGTIVTVAGPGGARDSWLYAERRHLPGDRALSELPESMRRDAVTVSYAVNPERRRETGRLWAWFPLKDETTAGGLFNAPWQINEDRTSLVRTSALNGELLEVCADLFLDVVVRASTSDDPAAHLDLFPARGDEARGDADRFLSVAIPRRARDRAMVPDLDGILRRPDSMRGVPDLDRSSLPRPAVDLWAQVAGRTDFPHGSCFTTDQRRSRLRSLLRAGGSGSEVTLSAWLEELVRVREQDRVTVALEIARGLSGARGIDRDEVLESRIVPTQSDEWKRLSECSSVLLPLIDHPVPAGITVVDVECASAISIEILRGFGVHEISADQILRTLAEEIRPSTDEQTWERFWLSATNATTRGALDVVNALVDRGIKPLLRSSAGEWVTGQALLADPSFAGSLISRHVDPALVSNVELLKAAGCLTSPSVDVVAKSEGLFSEYCEVAYAQVAMRAGDGNVDKAVLVRRLEGQVGAGPVSLLDEPLNDIERSQWTRQLISHVRTTEIVVEVPVIPRDLSFTVRLQSFELWAILTYGRLSTSLGFVAPRHIVGPRLKNFSWALPVVIDAGIGLSIGKLPESLAEVPDGMLREFLVRADYPAVVPTDFALLLNEAASRPAIDVPDEIPAIRGRRVVRVPRTEVFVATPAEATLIEEAGWAFVPATNRRELEENWELESAEAALSRSLEANDVDDETLVLDAFPTLQDFAIKPLRGARFARADSLYQVLNGGRRGVQRKRLRSGLSESGLVLIDRELDELDLLAAISHELGLGLTATDIDRVRAADRLLRHNELIARVRSAPDHSERLLRLVGAGTLVEALPRGLLPAVESRNGVFSERQIADLFLRVNGNDTVRVLREPLKRLRVAVPEKWDGSPNAVELVKALGFESRFAGTSIKRPASVTHVPGRISLAPLHDYQRDLAEQIRSLALSTDAKGESRRGLLYLPTGAGKTRVTVEAILAMLKSGEVNSPVLWVAQSQELCEQAIEAFSEVWRWLGDERPLDVSRFWSGYDVDESDEELQVVVAIDDTLASRFGERQYEWLTNAGIVVIDEAHSSMGTSYTGILDALGIAPGRTARPLLGLTATPFRGRNAETNQRFVRRFGQNRLEALDPADPIGELRRRNVLAEVDYRVLKGASMSFDRQAHEFYRQMKDVSRGMLDAIGQNLARTQTVVDDIRQEALTNQDWPILVFAASVASAHTIAALLRLDDVEADAVDGSMRPQERRRLVADFKSGKSQVLVNCDILTQGFDAPQVRALYIARPTFSPNRYLQMVGRGLRGPANGGTERCLIVNVEDTFEQFGEDLAYNEFDYLWSKK